MKEKANKNRNIGRKPDPKPVKKVLEKFKTDDSELKPVFLEINSDLQNELFGGINKDDNIINVKEDYLAIANLTGDIIIHADQNYKFTLLNDAACEFWGESQKKLLEQSFLDFINPEDIKNTVLITERMINERKIVKGLVNRQKTLDGWKTVEWNASPLYDKSGNHSGLLATGRDITERKKTEEILEKREAFNFALFQYNPAETIIVDLEGKIVRSNQAKKISGDRLPDIGDIMYKDYASKYKIDMYKNLMKSIRTNEVMKFPELEYADIYISVTISPFSEGAIIISEDITEKQKDMVIKSRVSKLKGGLYELLFENISREICDKLDSILKIDKIYGIGLARKEKVYGIITIATFADTKALDLELIEAVCNESSIALQSWIAHEAVLKSEEKYHSLTESISEVIYSLDTEGKVVFVGPQIERYGYVHEEVIGHYFLDFVLPEDKELVFNNLRSTMERGKEFPIRFRIIDKFGESHTIEDSGKFQRNESGEIIGVTGVLHDITERKLIEDALERKNMELNSLINNIPDMTWLMDSESRFIAVNRAFCEMVGLEREELENETCEVCFGKEKAKSFTEDDIKVMSFRKQLVIEEVIVDAHNNEILLETIKSPIITDSGDVVGTVGISRDITGRKRIENNLKISEEKLLEQQFI